MKYRMYIDEVGNPDLKASRTNENHRYLSLTGVIIDLRYVADVVQPRLEDLKRRYFGAHPDEPITLHRKELVNQKAPFAALLDPDLKQAFDTELLALLQELDYVVITVVIDKWAHLDQYRAWQYDPYHYCLSVLLERFVLWLTERNRHGDVMAESRGGKEDRRLKEEFTRIYREGTQYRPHSDFVQRLTSSQLKVQPKSANIAGLQLADLIAHPAFTAMKARRLSRPLAANFGGRIAEILELSKYRRSGAGRIDGYGRKWLP